MGTNDKSSPNLFVFMTDVSSVSGGIVGVAYFLGKVCSKQAIQRTNVVGYAGDDIFTAETIAHEIGHNLNMDHDFIQKGQKLKPRFCDTDSSINCQGFCNMMDYPPCQVDAWSCCSNSDFANMYNTLGSNFCLSESGSGGGNCKDKKKTKKCQKLKKKNKCKKKKLQRHARKLAINAKRQS